MRGIPGGQRRTERHGGGRRASRALALPRLWLALALLLGLAGAVAPARVARAAGIVVNSTLDTTGDVAICTLRDAIAAANTDTAQGGCTAGSGADTITFAAGVTGTITLTGTQLTIGSDLTITGPGASSLTVSGNNASRVFQVTSGTVAVSGLTASGGNADNGGGFLVTNSTLTLTSSTVSGNTVTTFGGGLAAISGANITLVNSTVSNNTTAYGAGGLYIQDSSTLTVIGSTVSGNHSGLAGGGIEAAAGGTVVVTNSTISGNRSDGAYGGIYAQESGSRLTLTNSTVSDNTAPSGGGQISSVFNGGPVTVTNSVVSSGTSPGSNCFGTITNGGHNLDNGTSCGFGTANGSLSNTDPKLAPLANNGGPTQTRALLPFSPAIDAGDTAACPATDQRGVARPVGAACDIGAFEVATANPAPALTSLSPATTPVVAGGAPDLTLTVNGTGFVAGGGSVARLNGTALTTTYVSATQLTAAVPAALRATAGVYPVTVTNSSPGGGTSNPLDLTVTNPVPAPTTLTPASATVDSGATGLTIAGSNFAPGATVDFGGTTLTPSSVAGGSIGVTIPAALLATARTVAVTVTNPGPGGGTSAPLPFTVGNPLPTATDLTPGSATAGGTALTLTVTGGGFVAGSAISFGGQTLVTTLVDATHVSATVPAAALQAAGTVAVRVVNPGPGGGASGPLAFVVNPADAAQLALAGGNAQSAPVNTAFATNLAVTVRDQFGNPVAAGTVVTFTAPASGASGTFPGGVTTATATTNAAGLATAPTFTANGVAGTYNVLATAGGGSVAFALTNTPGPAATLALSAPASAAAGAAVPVTVTVRDAAGNTVVGYTGTVHFTSGDGQAVLPTDYTFTGADAGVHTFTATLKTAGSQTITATDTVTASITGGATVAVAPAAPASIAATGGTPQSAQVGTAFAAPLAATVRDAFNNPVPGVAVTFAAPASGAGGTFPGGGATVTATTNASGVATAPAFTANGAVGPYSVVASGVAGSATFALTNTPGPATKLVVSALPASAAAGAPVTIIVTAQDSFGNAATGYTGTVRFTSSDGAATLPADYTFVAGDAGTHTFTATLRTGGAQTITATDTANGALSGSTTVTVAAATVTASTVGQGSISPSGTSTYAVGATATYTATPAAGQVFLGWTLDGQYAGYAPTLTFTVGGNRTLVAQFAARPTFSDIGTLSAADQQAITFLAALGIVNPAGVNGSGQFQPARDVKRAEVAAFVARVFGWQKEFHANPFPDKCDPANPANCVDDELWNNVAALKDYGVVGGYTDPATCQAGGTTAPCYLPRDPVQRVQVVSVVARAFILAPDLRPTGFWPRLDANAAQYTNVPNTGTQRSDLTTYRANVGTVPGQTSDAQFGDPTGPGSRLYVVQVLYAAFNAQYGVDRVP